MEFIRRGPDVAEVEASPGGTRVLFSYGQPVAVFTPRSLFGCAPCHPASEDRWRRTDVYVSKTTERHISDFVGKNNAERVSHVQILALAREA